MAKKTNDDMAGGVSEPKGQAPEVKPAKSLWPKPHTEIRAEPTLEPPQLESDPVAAPEVGVPSGDFETVPAEGHSERSDPVFEERAEPVFEEVSEPPELTAGESDAASSEPELEEYREPTISQNSEPRVEAESGPSFETSEGERTAAVFDAADSQEPALSEPGEGKASRFVAMAAGIVVALALGGVAFVYGASGLGLKFGGSDDTVASSPPSEPTPVTANADELKAAQDRIAELEAKIKAAEEERVAAEAAKAAAKEDTAALPPGPAQSSEPAPAASQQTTPEPAPLQAAKPEPAPQPVAPSEPKPKAEPARETAAAPSPPPQQLAPGPRNLDGQRPVSPPSREVARAEQTPPPPPRYDPQPSYNEPRATPEMPVLQGWQVRDVYNGIAVVQSGRGAPMEVEPGDNLPGGNRVLAIRRLGGSWAVVTERGIIAGY